MNDNAKPLRKPVDWDELYPGKYLKAGQLAEGKPITLTIKAVDVERLADDKGIDKIKGVITFAEIPYHLAMNKTNGLLLRELFGRVLDKWVGRKVTIYRGEVESGSQKGQPAVRVWGSPELTEDRVVKVQLPRKRPMNMTLHRVAPRDAARRPEVDRHPTEGRESSAGKDPDGGERPPF